ncbi:hypothetical protein MHBO_001028 [Bonamia ostreae]|uniref:Uncharacterized protein n=1 Tax=Bonamia ostreae TaxID=126728 RepID=A0ABV2AI42_9EUKA
MNCCSEANILRNQNPQWSENEQEDFVSKIKMCECIRSSLTKLVNKQKNIRSVMAELSKYTDNLVVQAERLNNAHENFRSIIAFLKVSRFLKKEMSVLKLGLAEILRSKLFQPLKNALEIHLNNVHDLKNVFVSKKKQDYVNSTLLKKEEEKSQMRSEVLEDLRLKVKHSGIDVETARSNLEKAVVEALTHMESEMSEMIMSSIELMRETFENMAKIEEPSGEMPTSQNYDIVKISQSVVANQQEEIKSEGA